jgi:hypothetical protein
MDDFAWLVSMLSQMHCLWFIVYCMYYKISAGLMIILNCAEFNIQRQPGSRSYYNELGMLSQLVLGAFPLVLCEDAICMGFNWQS